MRESPAMCDEPIFVCVTGGALNIVDNTEAAEYSIVMDNSTVNNH